MLDYLNANHYQISPINMQNLKYIHGYHECMKYSMITIWEPLTIFMKSIPKEWANNIVRIDKPSRKQKWNHEYNKKEICQNFFTFIIDYHDCRLWLIISNKWGKYRDKVNILQPPWSDHWYHEQVKQYIQFFEIQTCKRIRLKTR